MPGGNSKGAVPAVSRESTSSLHDRKFASMDLENGFNQRDSAGFIKINAIRLMAHHAIMRRKQAHWRGEA